MARPLKSITVRELIERLQDEDQDALVVVGADYGDHGHTEQALPLRGDIEQTRVTRSAYSDSGFAIADNDDEDADDDVMNDATIVVLR